MVSELLVHCLYEGTETERGLVTHSLLSDKARIKLIRADLYIALTVKPSALLSSLWTWTHLTSTAACRVGVIIPSYSKELAPGHAQARGMATGF